MKPEQLKQLLPNASKATIALNTDTEIMEPKLTRRGINQFSPWTEDEIRKLVLAYGTGYQEFSVERIAQELGRTVASVSSKANAMGLRNASRQKSNAHRKSMSLQRKGLPSKGRGKSLWKNREHPRGMLGKHHSVAAREAISSKQKGRKQNPEFVNKRLKSALLKGNLTRHRKHGSWKAGWRTIGGKKIYARSAWEANYARYLELLKKSGEIKEWEHEPRTFWFEGVKRGTRSYLPDFMVTLKDGSTEYHEVKGWMDSRSKTKARRMKKYHPDVIVIMRGSKWYKANRIKLSGIISDWEK